MVKTKLKDPNVAPVTKRQLKQQKPAATTEKPSKVSSQLQKKKQPPQQKKRTRIEEEEEEIDTEASEDDDSDEMVLEDDEFDVDDDEMRTGSTEHMDEVHSKKAKGKSNGKNVASKSVSVGIRCLAQVLWNPFVEIGGRTEVLRFVIHSRFAFIHSNNFIVHWN